MLQDKVYLPLAALVAYAYVPCVFAYVVYVNDKLSLPVGLIDLENVVPRLYVADVAVKCELVMVNFVMFAVTPVG